MVTEVVAKKPNPRQLRTVPKLRPVSVTGVGWLLAHAMAFMAVNTALVMAWALTADADLMEVVDSPGDAVALGFWPVWVILASGTLLVVHLGLVAGPGARRRRRQQRRERKLGRPGKDPTGTRWVAVLMSDLVGSTNHNERVGDEAWHALLVEHRRHVRSAIAKHQGAEVSTSGDGFLVRFDDPVQAVTAAIAIQRGHSRDFPPLRIGVHAGDAVHDGDDIVGRVVNMAARVSAEAGGGEILVTEPVADQLPDSLDVEDRGLKELKGIARPRHLLAVSWERATR